MPGIPGPVLGLATGYGAVPLQGKGGDGSEQFQFSGGARHQALAHRLVGQQVFGELAKGGDPSVPGGERQIPLLQQRGQPLRIQGSQPFHKGGTRIHPARLAPSAHPAGVNRTRHLAAVQTGFDVRKVLSMRSMSPATGRPRQVHHHDRA